MVGLVGYVAAGTIFIISHSPSHLVIVVLSLAISLYLLKVFYIYDIYHNHISLPFHNTLPIHSLLLFITVQVIINCTAMLIVLCFVFCLFVAYRH